jgi:hypothetical protein
MDSKMECMRSFIERDRLVDGCWTSYVSSLDRSVLKKKKYLEETPVSPAAAPPQVPPAEAIPPPRPRPISTFAEKLKGALGGGA